MELKEIEDKMWYNQLLMKSLEAKVERVEPYSSEFEVTMQNLRRLKEDQAILCGQLAKERVISAKQAMYRKDPNKS